MFSAPGKCFAPGFTKTSVSPSPILDKKVLLSSGSFPVPTAFCTSSFVYGVNSVPFSSYSRLLASLIITVAFAINASSFARSLPIKPSASTFCLSAASATTEVFFACSPANWIVNPFCFTAAKAISTSLRRLGVANCNASPFCFTASNTIS